MPTTPSPPAKPATHRAPFRALLDPGSTPEAPRSPVSPEFADLPATPGWPLGELQILASQVELGRTGRCMLLRAPVANGLALAQPGNWSTLTPQWAGAVDGCAGPIIVWMVSGTVPALPAAAGGGEGTSAWQLSEDDVFSVADVDGDGVDEIVVFKAGSGLLGVLRWTGTGLYAWWSGAGTLADSGGTGSWVPASGDLYLPVRLRARGGGGACLLVRNTVAPASLGPRMGVLGWDGTQLVTLYYQANATLAGQGGASWTLQTSDQWWTMDLTGSGMDSVMLYGSGYALGVVQWDQGSGAPSLAWSATLSIPGTYDWPMDDADQLVVASLDGNTQSLVLFNPTVPTIAVARWNASGASFGTVWSTTSSLAPNPAQGFTWQMHADNQLYAAALGGGGVDWIFFTDADWLGAASWDGTQLVSEWQLEGSVPGAGAINAWNRSMADQYAVVSAAEGGTDQLFVHDPQDGWVGLLSWNGSTLVSAWQTNVQLPGWAPPLIAAGPQLGYPAFVDADGSQVAEVYAYISNAVNPAGDLRTEYTNTNNADAVSGWTAWLDANPSPPASTGFSPTDWSTVQQALVQETQALSVVFGLYDNLGKLASALQEQQDSDLSYVIGMVAPDDSADQVFYWVGQALNALIWGAAALCGGVPRAAAGLSVTASVLGAGLGGSGGGPQLVDYTKVQGLIDDAYQATQSLNGLGQNLISGDAVKAQMAYWMAEGAWTWPSTSNSTAALATQTANRVAFYALLLPTTFNIYSSAGWSHPGQPVGIRSAPSYSYWGQQQGDGTWNVYQIAEPVSLHFDWPTEAMMTDIWGLGVQPQDFYIGNGPWAALPHRPGRAE